MCDCYAPKCESCEERIPVHIEDYDYPREDVQVFCSLHLPETAITIFTLIENEYIDEDDIEYPIGWKCGIRLQGGSIDAESVGVDPNVSAWNISEHIHKNHKQ